MCVVYRLLCLGKQRLSQLPCSTQESEKYGEAVQIERKGLQDTYDSIVRRAADELAAAKSGEDFGKMVDSLRKYGDYPGDAKTAWSDLQKAHDSLLESTKETLRGIMSSQDPAEIDVELVKYDSDFGEAISEETRALAERKTELFRAAQTEMQGMASNKDAPIEDLDALIEKYASWPDDIRGARDALTSAHRARLTDLTKQAADLQQRGDMGAVESLLLKYGAAMEKHMGETYDGLKRYQTTMVEKMQVTLKEGMQNSTPSELSELIKQSTQFGDALQNERKALESRLDDVVKASIDDMKGQLKSDDYPAMVGTMKLYEGFPPETKEARDQLEKHADEILETAKQKLRDLLTSRDPQQIQEELGKYDGYDAAIQGERDAINKRRTQLLDEAKNEMTTLTAKVDPRLAELNEVIAKYAEYPEEVRPVLDALKTKKSQVLAKVKDELSRGQVDDDVISVDKLLSEFAEKPDLIEEVKDQYDALQAHRKKLNESMAAKMTEGVNRFEVPSALEELLAASDIYGESLEGERKALRQQIDKLVKGSIDEMKSALKSDDYLDVTSKVEKFKSFPEETREVWKQLQTHWEEVVDKEKKILRDLAQTEVGDRAVAVTLDQKCHTEEDANVVSGPCANRRRAGQVAEIWRQV
eukprot:SAG11_NODE_301_length_11038_cov_2.312826_13_plen_643_part_00